MLERWRERDVFQRSLANREGAPLWSFYEGPPTANGRPGSHHVLARVFKDIYPRFQTMTGHQVPRKAGWDCHGLPVELEVEKELGHHLEGGDRGLRDRRVQPALPRVGLPLRRGLEPADRADRLLARPRRPLRDDDQRLHRVGLVGAAADLGRRPPLRGPQGRPLLPALRHRALLARGRPRLPRRRGPLGLREAADRARRRATDPRVAARAGRPAAGLDDHAVDADHQRRGRRRRRRSSTSRAPRLGDEVLVLARDAGRARSSARTPRCSRTSPARRSPAPRYEPPFDYITDYGPRGHTVLLADFVTTEEGTGLVHTAIAFGEDDFRLGEQYGITLQNPVDRRRHLRRAGHRLRRPLRQGGRPRHRRGPRGAGQAAPRRDLPARLSALLALRHAAPLLREGELVRRRPPRSATGCWPPTRRSAGTPSTSSTAASASGSRTTSTGRSRATATGARRCRSGSATPRTATSASAPARSPSCASAAAEVPDDLHRPYIDEVSFACEREGCDGDDAPRRRGDRHLVRLGRDAVGAVPLPVRERGAVRGALPRRLHLRGDRPDPRLVLHAARRVGPALRHLELPQRASASA